MDEMKKIKIIKLLMLAFDACIYDCIRCVPRGSLPGTNR